MSTADHGKHGCGIPIDNYAILYNLIYVKLRRIWASESQSWIERDGYALFFVGAQRGLIVLAAVKSANDRYDFAFQQIRDGPLAEVRNP